MLARIGFLLHFYRAQLPHGRTPIASHTSLFTGVMPCQSPVDLCPTNRLNFSSPRTAGRGGAFNHRFFPPPSFSWKTIRVRAASEKGGLQACLLGGGESGRFAFCVLWPGAGSRRRAAPNLIPKPGRRQFPLLPAPGDEVPAACGGPSTPGGGPSPLHGTTKLPHCIEVRVGGVWRGAAPVVGIVANVAEVGG